MTKFCTYGKDSLISCTLSLGTQILVKKVVDRNQELILKKFECLEVSVIEHINSY